MQIEIKGKKWSVERFESQKPVVSLAGQTLSLDKKLFVSNMPEYEEETFLTIIHELTHAYMFETGLRNLQEMEETFCYWLEANFIEILANAITIAKELFDIDFKIIKEKKERKK